MYGLRRAPLKARVDEVLAIIGLADRQKDKLRTFSGGMKRRVNIGAALLDEAAAREAVRTGAVDAALLIPAGFSATTRTGGLSQLTLVADETTVKGQTTFQLLRGPLTQVFSAVAVADLTLESITASQALSADEAAAENEAAFQLAWETWGHAQNETWVTVQRATAPTPQSPFGENPFNQSSPGILVQFAIFGLITSATVLVQERKQRTLERMLSTALSPLEIIGGHFLAMVVITLLQQVVLIIFGQFALGVNYLREPLGVLAVMLALSVCTASFGLLIGVFSKNESQVTLFGLISMFTFSALGGAWFPLEVAGPAFATVGRLTPTAWAMTGFQNILVRGLDASATLVPVGVLLAYTVVFMALALWRFRRL